MKHQERASRSAFHALRDPLILPGRGAKFDKFDLLRFVNRLAKLG